MSKRRWAELQLDDGLTTKITRKQAFELIEVGELTMVRKRPLTVQIPKHKEFHEDQRHLSGRRIPGVSKGRFNGEYSTASGIRCRPPRSAQNQDYLMTLGWVRQRQREIEEEREKAVEEQEKANKRKKRRRRKRRG